MRYCSAPGEFINEPEIDLFNEIPVNENDAKSVASYSIREYMLGDIRKVSRSTMKKKGKANYG